MTVIGAHFGGWSIWEDACQKYGGKPNFYVDCSSSFNYINKETAKKLILHYGVDRVMFATDYPMWDPETEIEFFLNLGLDESQKKNILNINAKKVFNLDF